MSEKKTWISPVTAVQRFAANDHVTSCWFHKIQAVAPTGVDDYAGDLYVYHDPNETAPEYERGGLLGLTITGVTNADLLTIDRPMSGVDSNGNPIDNATYNIVEADLMGYNGSGIYYAKAGSTGELALQKGFFDQKGRDGHGTGRYQYGANVSFFDTGVERGYFTDDGWGGTAYISQRWIAATSFDIIETKFMAGWYS